MNRLQEKYINEIVPQLQKEFGFKNVMQIPSIKKIMINVGVGKSSKDTKFLENIVADLKKITGQVPVKRTAKKSIAGFKSREGQLVGYNITLRGERMYDFLDKLISVALPRVRDFRGLTADSMDGRGSYHLGLKEHLVFPEISQDALEHTFGLQVSIVTNAKVDAPGKRLLQLMDFPFNN